MAVSPESAKAPPRILVLGVGNSLWSDEGFGLRAVEALHQRYRCPANVTLADGNAEGPEMAPLIDDAEILLLLDAVETGQPPGTLKIVDGPQILPLLAAETADLHQSAVLEALRAALAVRTHPKRIRLIGIQPLELETYARITPEIAAQIDLVLRETLEFLKLHGAAPAPRPAGEKIAPLGAPSLAVEDYESGMFA